MDRRHKFIVSDKFHFIYYEVQKCASEAMREYFLYKPAMPYEAKRLSGSGRGKAIPYERKGYYRFSFVRNPWSRIVSAWLSKFVHYHDPKHPDLPGIRDPELSLDTTFEEFVGFVCKTPDSKADCHFLSMHQFLPPACDVGKIENLKEDFDIIRQNIGLPIYDIPMRNFTKHKTKKHWRDFYNRELKMMVAERYAEDITLYDYKFNA